MTERQPLILIAEDGYLTASELGAVLTAHGYRVALACSPERAWQAADEEKPSVAIVDLNLRDGLDGAELAERLARRGVAIIVCSGYGEALVQDVVRRVPGACVIGKPVMPKCLIEAVARTAAELT